MAVLLLVQPDTDDKGKSEVLCKDHGFKVVQIPDQVVSISGKFIIFVSRKSISVKYAIMPAVSIIVPCYNHGKYIMDTVNSVEQIKDKDLYELIIINDGSTDEFTNQQCRELQAKGYNVVFQQNQGLARTRNNAIKLSTGKYILPLDSDNKIRPEYVYKGIEILDSRKDISIVYGNAAYFGDQQGEMKQGWRSDG